jgi:DNA-binding NarL/FixJ family response regulator
MPKSPIRLLVADGQPMLRTGLRTVLGAEPDLAVVGEAGDGAEAFALARRLRPDVVLMATRMPRADGAAATRDIVAMGLSVRVLLLAADLADPVAAAALRAGAHGLLSADVPPTTLAAAVRAVAGGATVLDSSVLGQLLDPSRPGAEVEPTEPGQLTSGQLTSGQLTSGQRTSGQLTDREREVLVHLARGRSNAEIAVRLRVSETTVKTHVRHVLTKLGLRDRVQAVVFAYESGLIRPGR